MFCKHEWKILSETVTESKLELIIRVKARVKDGGGALISRKHIQVFTCDKCGKLNRFMERI